MKDLNTFGQLTLISFAAIFVAHYLFPNPVSMPIALFFVAIWWCLRGCGLQSILFERGFGLLFAITAFVAALPSTPADPPKVWMPPPRTDYQPNSNWYTEARAKKAQQAQIDKAASQASYDRFVANPHESDAKYAAWAESARSVAQDRAFRASAERAAAQARADDRQKEVAKEIKARIKAGESEDTAWWPR